MAHAQKPDFVFRRNGRVHLNRQWRQCSRLLAAEVCTSAIVMLDTLCSEVVWRELTTHSICQFPLHFPSRASPCAITFQLESNAGYTIFRGSVKSTGYTLYSPVSPSLAVPFVTVCHDVSTGLYLFIMADHMYRESLVTMPGHIPTAQWTKWSPEYIEQAVTKRSKGVVLQTGVGLCVIRYMIYLLTAIGLSPGGSSTVHIYTQIHIRTQITTEQHK